MAPRCACVVPLGLLALPLLLGPAMAQDNLADICPATSAIKTLPFLKAAKPDAINQLIDTSGGGLPSLKMDALTGFVKDTLVPLIGANVFFLVLAFLFLVIFLLWRGLRWCCLDCCCKSSCDAKREGSNPQELLFGKRMRIIKATMMLFALIAIIFAIYGMASVKKELVPEAFGVVNSVGDFAKQAVSRLDGLLDTVRGINGIIDELQGVVTDDIQVDAVVANLTAIGTFLDRIDPAIITASADALNAAVTALNSSLDGFLQGAAAMTGALRDDQEIAVQALRTGTTHIAAPVRAVNTHLGWGNSATERPEDDIDGLQSDLQDLLDQLELFGVDALLDAVDFVSAISNPFAATDTLLQPVTPGISGIAAEPAGAAAQLRQSIGGMLSDYETARPVIAGLLAHMAHLNETVLALDGPMAESVASMQAASEELDAALVSTSPAGIIANLTDLQAALSNATVTDLFRDAATDLQQSSTTITADFGGAQQLDPYKAWLQGVRNTTAHLVPLPGPDATQVLQDFKDALDAYLIARASASGSGAAEWQAFRDAPASTAAIPLLQALGVDFASPVVAFSGEEPAIMARAAAVASPYMPPASVVPAAAAATAMQSLLGSLPKTDTLTSNLGSFSNPGSAVTSNAIATLSTIRDTAMKTGNEVKAMISTNLAGIESSTAGLRGIVDKQLGGLEADYGPMAKEIDGYRYQASMALYGVSILFVVLLLLSAYANYHFGANMTTFWLLLISVLYFLLALVIGLLVSFLHMGCGQLEDIVSAVAPANFAPLLQYYFNNEPPGASAVDVLSSAGIVDLGSITQQIDASRGEITLALTSQFTFSARPGPAAIVGRINDTITAVLDGIDGLVGMADRESLLPVYAGAKTFICCGVPDVFGSMWTGLTFAGVFAFALIFTTFWYIGRIDRCPRRDCCGCSCHTKALYAGTVYEAHPDGLPTCVPASAGAYTPPNGAIWGSTSGEAVVVVNAPPSFPKKP